MSAAFRVAKVALHLKACGEIRGWSLQEKVGILMMEQLGDVFQVVTLPLSFSFGRNSICFLAGLPTQTTGWKTERSASQTSGLSNQRS